MQLDRDFQTIPVVDIGPFLHGGPAEQAAVVERLRDICSRVGFFYMLGHGVAPELAENLVDVAKRFFARSLEDKMLTYIGRSSHHRGYVPEGEEVFAGGSKDLKEAFDLALEIPADDPESLKPYSLIGPNQWPEVPGFREAATAYYTATFAVGRQLMRAFAVVLGEPAEAFDAHLTRPPSQMRLIHYPFDAAAVDSVGIGAHTDYECFTLLHCTGPGLEVLNGSGEWIDVPPLAGAYVVNIGDMLELLSNGALIATSHRVRKTTCERYSFPLFCSLDHDTHVRPLDRFVSADRPARPGLIAGEHLFAQIAQTFRYQIERIARGEVRLPPSAVGLSSFGQEAMLGLSGPGLTQRSALR